MSNLQGILGLSGREPIGAALTIGVKDKAKGFPTERDRFHIVAPNEGEGGRRPYLPDFRVFNEAPAGNRRTVRGNIVHANRAACFEFSLKNQVQPGGQAHPDRRPFCVGDGARAVRWTGKDADDFQDIACPHDRCEFRQDKGKGPACKPWMRLLFRLSWDDATQRMLQEKGRPPFPTPLTKFTSGSWNTTRNVLGFFEFIESAARQMGIDDYTLFGLPFVLNLSMRTKPSSKSAFPVVSMSPLIDPVDWFRMQREQLRQIQAPVRHVALTDQSEQDADVIAGDYETVSAGIPSC